MWLTVFQTINKKFLLFALIYTLILCSSCTSKVEEFESRCQGWNDELALSNEIYRQLNMHHYEHYITINLNSSVDRTVAWSTDEFRIKYLIEKR